MSEEELAIWRSAFGTAYAIKTIANDWSYAHEKAVAVADESVVAFRKWRKYRDPEVGKLVK